MESRDESSQNVADIGVEAVDIGVFELSDPKVLTPVSACSE